MATTPSSSTSKSEPSLKEVSAQLDALKADLAHLSEAMGDYGKSRYRQARHDVEGRARSARASAEEGVGYLQDEAEYYAKEADRFVKTQPGTALGIAAGIGFLVGLFASRR